MTELLSLLESSTARQALILLAIGVLCFALLRRAYRFQASREQRDRLPPSPPPSPARAQDLVGRLEVRLNETAREVNARLDTKMRVLNELLFEADARIAELKALRREATHRSRDESTAVRQSADDPFSSARRGSTGDAGSRAIDAERDFADRSEGGYGREWPDPRFAEIYKLADDGYSARQISEKVNQPVGAVDLILGLRHRRSASRAPEIED